MQRVFSRRHGQFDAKPCISASFLVVWIVLIQCPDLNEFSRNTTINFHSGKLSRLQFRVCQTPTGARLNDACQSVRPCTQFSWFEAESFLFATFSQGSLMVPKVSRKAAWIFSLSTKKVGRSPNYRLISRFQQEFSLKPRGLV